MNYDKLIEEFGSQAISPALIKRFERVTGKRAHTWIRVVRAFLLSGPATRVGPTYMLCASRAPQRGSS
jgi:hypothetical protein